MKPVLSSHGVRHAAGGVTVVGADAVRGTSHPMPLGLFVSAVAMLCWGSQAEANTPNQNAASEVISGLSSDSALYWSIYTSSGNPYQDDFTEEQAQAFLLRAPGDAYVSYSSSVMLADLDLAQAPMSNLRRNLADPGAAMPFWIRAYRGESRVDDDGNAGKAEQDFEGMMLGGDLPIPGEWRLGGAFGFGDERLDVKTRDSKADSDSSRYTLYGGRDLDLSFGALKFFGGAGYSKHEIDSHRSIVPVTGPETLSRRYDVTTRQAFAEAAYHLDFGKPAYVEPFFGVLTLEQRSDAFREQGGVAALSAESQRNRLLSTTSGVRGQQVFLLAGRELLLYGSFTWRQLNGDLRPEMRFSFDETDSFKVRGSELPRNSYLLEMNADYTLAPNIVLDVDYSGVFSTNSRSSSFAVNLRWKM